MKITKSQLKKIIKEELKGVLQESFFSWRGVGKLRTGTEAASLKRIKNIVKRGGMIPPGDMRTIKFAIDNNIDVDKQILNAYHKQLELSDELLRQGGSRGAHGRGMAADFTGSDPRQEEDAWRRWGDRNPSVRGHADWIPEMFEEIEATLRLGEPFDEEQLRFLEWVERGDAAGEAGLPTQIRNAFYKQIGGDPNVGLSSAPEHAQDVRRHQATEFEEGSWEGVTGERFKTNPHRWRTNWGDGKPIITEPAGPEYPAEGISITIDEIFNQEMARLSWSDKARLRVRDGSLWKEKYKYRIEKEWEIMSVAKNKRLMSNLYKNIKAKRQQRGRRYK